MKVCCFWSSRGRLCSGCVERKSFGGGYGGTGSSQFKDGCYCSTMLLPAEAPALINMLRRSLGHEEQGSRLHRSSALSSKR